jgi:CubicO group peptidase (beta-lactamase class C family)
MHKTLGEAVSLYSQSPLVFEPGTKWQYSNAGIATLGRIVEVASDQSYDQFLATRVFQPLGMSDTYVFPPQEKWDRIATVYTFTDGKLKPAGPDTLGGGDWKYRKGAKYPLPEGGLYSTATDLAAFYQMMLNGGTFNGKRILSKPTIDIMTAVHTGDLMAGHQPGMGYGLAWSVVKGVQGTLALPLLSEGTYHHGGAFGTHGWVDPKRDLVGVFLVQRPGANDERNAFMAIAGSAIRD